METDRVQICSLVDISAKELTTGFVGLNIKRDGVYGVRQNNKNNKNNRQR